MKKILVTIFALALLAFPATSSASMSFTQSFGEVTPTCTLGDFVMVYRSDPTGNFAFITSTPCSTPTTPLTPNGNYIFSECTSSLAPFSTCNLADFPLAVMDPSYNSSVVYTVDSNTAFYDWSTASVSSQGIYTLATSMLPRFLLWFLTTFVLFGLLIKTLRNY